MKIIEFVSLFELLGQKPSKRFEKLISIRKNNPSAELVVCKDNCYIVVPDESITLDKLVKSNLITEIQRQAIQNIIDGVGLLKTEHRNSVLEIYRRYYSFAYFSLDKGKDKKLLLGNENKKSFNIADGRKTLNSSKEYLSEGAYLLYCFFRSAYNQEIKPLKINYYKSKGGYTYLVTKTQLFEAAIAKIEPLINTININELNQQFIDEKNWQSLIVRYKSDKKDFYQDQIKQYLEELEKISHLRFNEKIVGDFLVSNNEQKDKELILKNGLLVNSNFFVCNAITRILIMDEENKFVKSLGLRDLKEAYTGLDKNAKEFRKEMSSYFKENWQLKTVYRTLGVELDKELNKPEFESIFCIEEDISNVRKSVVKRIENEWQRRLRQKIRDSDTDSYLPSAYYNNLLNLIAYSYLDNYNGYSKFSKNELIQILAEFIDIPASIYDSFSNKDLIELGIQKEDVQKQLEDDDIIYDLKIPSYRILKDIKKAVNNYQNQ